jgi:hypothetical protein
LQKKRGGADQRSPRFSYQRTYTRISCREPLSARFCRFPARPASYQAHFEPNLTFKTCMQFHAIFVFASGFWAVFQALLRCRSNLFCKWVCSEAPTAQNLKSEWKTKGAGEIKPKSYG